MTVPAGSLAKGRRGRRVPLSVAPMMDLTDRHFRYLLRCVSRRTLLYTEMVAARAVLHGDRSRLLAFHPDEHPIALQLGGDDPTELAEAARIGTAFGYDEIDLNVGCPSQRVASGNFGACLMATPTTVARAVEAMRAATPLPVTVKHRIGIDDADAFEDLLAFVDTVAAAGADAFAVHARKAWLSGLSPKENRTIPPLRYGDVHRLKRERPELTVEINGGVRDLGAARRQLELVDGVMIGRAAYEAPMILADADALLWGEPARARSAHEVARAMLPYIELRRAEGVPLHAITRHMLGLFRGVPGARAYRRHVSERAHDPGAGPEVVEGALRLIAEGADVRHSRVGYAPAA